MASQSLKEQLLGRFTKAEMVELLNENEAFFNETIRYALQNEPTLSWRAAWVLYHAMEEKDVRLQYHVQAFTEAIEGKGDGHQRELLRIIEQLDIPEELEGRVFDTCMTIWEQVGKIPSVRWFAFRIICSITMKYPDLKSEIPFITQVHYIETLSPGIRKAVERLAGQK